MLDIKEKRHITVVGRGGASNIDWEDIENKPDFAEVATSGSYNDLTDKPEIPGQVNADWNANSGVAQILNKPNLATVATSGSYNDLTDKPTILTQWFGTQAEYDAIVVKDPNTIYNIEGGQVQANWTENDSSDPSYIQNKPTLATVATSGSYNDLSNTPNLATVATSGSYNDLTNKPAVKEDMDLSTLTQAQYADFYTNYNTYKANYDLNWGGMPILSINSWQPDTSISPVPLIVLEYGIYGQSALMTGGDDEVYFGVQLIGADGSVTPYSSSMTFKQICHTASYNDLVDKPTLATVATSGSYNDLSNKPTIPAAQVNADWDANSGVSQILNKPTLATVATSGDYSDLTNTPNLATVATSGSYNDLTDKPEIPSVPAMATQELTFTLQGGTVKTVEFYTVPNYFYVEDISGSSNTLSITKTDSSAPTIEVFKSTDRMNWTSMGSTSTTAITATIPANGKLYLKATTNAWSTSNNPYNYISASGNYNVGGNIMSLLYGDNFEGKTTFQREGVFKWLFSMGFNYNNALISAEKLILPATTLTHSCYYGMFQYCTALTKAPTLATTILTTSCYSRMFYGCSSLNKVVTYANNISASQCLYNWLNGVSATGDFYNLGGATYTSGTSGIPSGWTEHTSL